MTTANEIKIHFARRYQTPTGLSKPRPACNSDVRVSRSSKSQRGMTLTEKHNEVTCGHCKRII